MKKPRSSSATQTELLRGFERFSGGQTITLRRMRADLSNVDAESSQRLELVERRLMEIERHLLIDPPPAPGSPPPAVS